MSPKSVDETDGVEAGAEVASTAVKAMKAMKASGKAPRSNARYVINPELLKTAMKKHTVKPKAKSSLTTGMKSSGVAAKTALTKKKGMKTSGGGTQTKGMKRSGSGVKKTPIKKVHAGRAAIDDLKSFLEDGPEEEDRPCYSTTTKKKGLKDSTSSPQKKPAANGGSSDAVSGTRDRMAQYYILTDRRVARVCEAVVR